MFFQINRFHFFALITWQLGIFFASQMIFSIFSGYVPRWRCTGAITEPFTKNCTIWDSCGGRVEFEYDYFHSSALEFEWICGPKAYWAHFYSQLQFIGVLIGTILWGTVSDCIGRKPVALFVLSLGITMNAVSGLVPSWEWLLVTRFFIGLCIGGTVVVVCAFVMEMLLPQQRMALRAFFNWGTARLWMTFLCYIFPDWRRASLACAFFAMPAPFIILFIFPESPTWLHSKGRIEQMRQSEMKIARFAGIPYVEIQHDPILQKQSFTTLFRDKALFRRVFVLWLMWFVASICGYTIDLNSSTILGHLFLNQALFSVLIASSKMILVAYDTMRPSFSRRNLHQYSQAAVCICFLVLSLLAILNEHGVWILIINLIGIVFIEYTWDACYLCGVESVPTSLRTTCLGSCSFMARIGAVFAPSLAYLNTMWAPSAYITVVAVGLVNLFISYRFLVETKGINLDRVDVHTTQMEPIMISNEEVAVKMLAMNDNPSHFEVLERSAGEARERLEKSSNRPVDVNISVDTGKEDSDEQEKKQ